MRLAAVLIVALCACNEGSGLVRVDVDADPMLALDAVELSLTSEQDGGTTHNRQVIAWPTTQSLSVGLYLPTSVSGTVWAHARALQGNLTVGVAEPKSVSASPGQVSGPVRLHLMVIPLSPGDGGVPADGGATGDARVPDGPAPDASSADAVADVPPATDGTTPGRSWAPLQVEMDPIDRDDAPVVAVDPVKGDAVALFVEKQAQLEAVRYTRSADAWSAPQVIATGARMDNAKVGMDAAGHVFAVWTQAAEGVLESHSADRGMTWSKPALIRASTTATATSLAVGRNNRARAAWEESVDNHDTLFTAYFDGNTWASAAMPLASNDFFGTRQASIAVDPAGAGWLAWAQPEPASPSASEHLYLSRFTGAALETPVIVDREGASVQPPPVLAMAPDGKSAVVVWQENFTAGPHDYLASIWSGATWSAPEKAVVGGGERPDVTMDASGAVTLAYQMILPASGTRNAMVVRREAGQWTAPKALETGNAAPGGPAMDGREPMPVARADAQGNVWVVWRKGSNATTYGLAAARFVVGQGWMPELGIASRQDLAVSWPLSMGSSDDGRALVVWVYVRGAASAMDADLYNLYAAFSR